jgi:hypothetical protein
VAQTPRQTISIGQTICLFVFVATVAIFLGALANAVLAGLHDVQDFAVAFSYLVAIVAVVAMAVDVYDLWVRGRRFNKANAKSFKMVVMVAVLASMATTLLGKNMTLVIFLMPSILIYYMTMRPQPATARAGGAARGAGAPRGAVSSGGGKTRQRRGGRKRR